MTKNLLTAVKKHPLESSLLAAGCLLRLVMLRSRHLWFDEAVSLMIATSPLSQVLPLVRHFEINPPLYFFILNLWNGFFPDPFFALRFFSAACGAGCLFVFLALAREVAPKQAPFALFLACFSSFWIHMAQEGRPYCFFLLLGLVTTRIVWRAGQGWSTKRGLVYAAAGAAGLYTHFAFAFLLMAHAVHLVWSLRGDWRKLKPWLWVHAAIGAAFLPWVSDFSTQTHYDFAVANLSHPMTGGRSSFILGNLTFDWVFLNTAVESWIRLWGWATGAVLAAGTVFLAKRRGEDRERLVFCALHCLLPFVVVKAVDVLLHRSAGQTRYLIFVSPFFYLWLALALEAVPRAVSRLIETLLAAALVLLSIGYFAPSLYAPSSLPRLSAWAATAPPEYSVVHLSPLDFLSMRYYYLPGRRHYLLDPDSHWLDWKALPGYPGVLSAEELKALGPCVVIDPYKKRYPQGFGVSTGAELLKGP